jgi:hypothetical protein
MDRNMRIYDKQLCSYKGMIIYAEMGRITIYLRVNDTIHWEFRREYDEIVVWLVGGGLERNINSNGSLIDFYDDIINVISSIDENNTDINRIDNKVQAETMIILDKILGETNKRLEALVILHDLTFLCPPRMKSAMSSSEII